MQWLFLVNATYDLNFFAVKLTSFTGTLSNLYKGSKLTGGTSGVVADVIEVAATDGTDPDTLFVKYRNSGTDNVSTKFTDGETVTSGQTAASTALLFQLVLQVLLRLLMLVLIISMDSLLM